MKWLVDTSVWIDHLDTTNLRLAGLLRDNAVLMHSAVIGELACGNLPNRRHFLEDISLLPRVREASFEEVLQAMDFLKLHGLGIGWVDAQLLVSSLLFAVPLWTLDRRLDRVARAIEKTRR